MALPFPKPGDASDGGAPLNLRQAIDEFYAEFPEHKDDVFILNHQEHRRGASAVTDILPDMHDLKQKHPGAMIDISLAQAAQAFDLKLPCSISITEGPFSFEAEAVMFARIVIPAGSDYTAKKLRTMLSQAVPGSRYPDMSNSYNDTEMWQRYVLDHELGHALTLLKLDKQSAKHTSLMNKAECEADAYAMIRHFQRYGEKSTFPEMIRDLRNMSLVHMGDTSHWTVRAIEEVMRINAQGGIKNLTPHESRDLAVKIAASVALSSDAEYNMQRAFSRTAQMTVEGYRNRWSDGDRVMGYVERVAKMGATTQSQGVLEACQKYLARFAVYAPKDMPMSKTPDQLKAMALNMKETRARTVTSEPPMDGLSRFFRDAAIDFQSGAGRKRGADNDNGKKDAPKKNSGDGGNKKPPAPPLDKGPVF